MVKNPLTWLLLSSLALTACGHVTPGFAANAPYGAVHTFAKARSGAAYSVTNTVNGSEWARIERLTSTNPSFPTERARPEGRQTDAETIAAFGTATPPSRDVALHYMQGWDTGKGVPVLLVHGALLDATDNWLKPHGKVGLAPALAAQGRRVFAVTFAHRHGDNLLQAEQLANAIDRVKAVTGASQVDVVAHSKGTVVARALVSGVKQPWMRGYGHDVRRLVLIGAPNLGLDYAYRHPAINLALYPEKTGSLMGDAPMTWTRMIAFGVWVDTSAQALDAPGGGCFPGQAQMLAKFDKQYPLEQTEQDWYTTYYGGQGFISYSKGIDHAIETGGHFMDRLRKSPLDANVQLAVLAGDKADLDTVIPETAGPSDSIVFVESATATDDLTRGGAKLIDKTVMHLNHMNLVAEPSAHAWVAGILDRP